MEPVGRILDIPVVHVPQGEIARAQELLCACGAELREVKTDKVAGGHCAKCNVVYVWRWEARS